MEKQVWIALWDDGLEDNTEYIVGVYDSQDLAVEEVKKFDEHMLIIGKGGEFGGWNVAPWVINKTITPFG